MTPELIAYKRLPNWTIETIPESILHQHNTKAGTWAHLTILSGKLAFDVLDETGQVLSSYTFDPDSTIPFVEPQVWHKVRPLSQDIQFYLTFYCQPQDYFKKKYDLASTHSEVFKYQNLFSGKKVLDLGAGSGRNALYLAQQGCTVTALDQNDLALSRLNTIAQAENLNLTIDNYDINTASLTNRYDVILSTVVFMFLQKDHIANIRLPAKL